jgi:hypothetical protein
MVSSLAMSGKVSTVTSMTASWLVACSTEVCCGDAKGILVAPCRSAMEHAGFVLFGEVSYRQREK